MGEKILLVANDQTLYNGMTEAIGSVNVLPPLKEIERSPCFRNALNQIKEDHYSAVVLRSSLCVEAGTGYEPTQESVGKEGIVLAHVLQGPRALKGLAEKVRSGNAPITERELREMRKLSGQIPNGKRPPIIAIAHNSTNPPWILEGGKNIFNLQLGELIGIRYETQDDLVNLSPELQGFVYALFPHATQPAGAEA